MQAVVLERVQARLNSAAGRDQLAAAADRVADGDTDHHQSASVLALAG